MELKQISKQHRKWIIKMGWANVKTPLECLALICSEVGEAANECRGKKPTKKLGSELADIILRVLGMSEDFNIDIEKEIIKKMKKNRKRGKIGRLK